MNMRPYLLSHGAMVYKSFVDARYNICFRTETDAIAIRVSATISPKSRYAGVHKNVAILTTCSVSNGRNAVWPCVLFFPLSFAVFGTLDTQYYCAITHQHSHLVCALERWNQQNRQRANATFKYTNLVNDSSRIRSEQEKLWRKWTREREK